MTGLRPLMVGRFIQSPNPSPQNCLIQMFLINKRSSKSRKKGEGTFANGSLTEPSPSKCFTACYSKCFKDKWCPYGSSLKSKTKLKVPGFLVSFFWRRIILLEDSRYLKHCAKLKQGVKTNIFITIPKHNKNVSIKNN